MALTAKAKDIQMTTYISTTDTSKLIRKVLKESFNGCKFSVRSSSYSMGSSISVSWTDGPNQAQVDALLSRFEGSGFNGMEDYKYSIYHKMNGETVSFGPDSVHTNRSFSDDVEQRNNKLFTKHDYESDWDIKQRMNTRIRLLSFIHTAESKTAKAIVVTGSEYEEQEKAQAEREDREYKQQELKAQANRAERQERFANATGTVKVKSILVESSESGLLGSGVEYSLEDFEIFSAMACKEANGYFKTKVVATFDDGNTYGCRVDLSEVCDTGFVDHMMQVVDAANTPEGAEYYKTFGKDQEFYPFILNFFKTYDLGLAKQPVSNVVSIDQARAVYH